MSADGPDLAALTAVDFEPFLGEEFTLRAADGSVQAVLGEVDAPERPAGWPAELRTPFAIEFHAPLEPALQQGNHSIEHPRFGAIVVMITVHAPHDGAARYRVQFA